MTRTLAWMQHLAWSVSLFGSLELSLECRVACLWFIVWNWCRKIRGDKFVFILYMNRGTCSRFIWQIYSAFSVLSTGRACENMSWLNMINGACFCLPNSFFQFSFISPSPGIICIVNVRVYKGEVKASQTFRLF